MSEYTEAVERGLLGLDFVSVGLAAYCQECRRAYGIGDEGQQDFQDSIDTGETIDEGGFSWQSCGCCGSHLGGNRYAAHGFNSAGELVHLEVCEDCLCYIANGDEPEEWQAQAR